MRVVIIEDELLAAERLQHQLLEYDDQIQVVAHLYSIAEAVNWLETHRHPDLLFLDIQLADGYSFEIFKQIDYRKPIIFTTAFDQYALDAFQLHSIAYLLKPVSAGMLAKSLQKYKELCTPVTAQTAAALLHSFEQPEYKTRFLAKSGHKMYFIPCDDIRYFFAEDKIVYLVDRDGNKFTVDYTMEKLEKCLDPKVFFRLNRSYLVHQQSIFQIKPHINSRYKLTLRNAGKNEEVIISRERVKDFKVWAEA
ncbi:LytR/AlgR family response regulator transcription factor [Phnomibacter sp. MR]|uniref:LytR/AlgR family response regulator transcription factor n=1 Tax=Phnomibacter sp. MR TaxID=3042318 RepID=UPI003A80AE59